MKRIAGLLLTLALPLAACSGEAPSADTAGTDTPQPLAQIASTEAPSTPTRPPARPAQPSPATTLASTGDDEKFQNGKHYRQLTPTQPTSSSPDKVEVAEIFMYTCPHCFTFEPHVQRWVNAKPASVSFVRIPANFNALAALHLRAYYTAETLGILDTFHEPFFSEIHVKNNMVKDEKALAAFFAQHGVDQATLDGTINSFAVDTKMRQAEDLARRYRISSVPTVVVNGKYVTDGRMAGSYPVLLEVIDFLVAKEAEALARAAGSEDSSEAG